MEIPFFIRRIVAAALCAIFFTTQCVLAHVPETNLWAERRRSIQSYYSSNVLQPLSPLVDRALKPVLSEEVVKNLSKILPHRHMDILSALPYLYGNIRRVSPPQGTPSGKLVIHIQDVHMNAEAQKNI